MHRCHQISGILLAVITAAGLPFLMDVAHGRQKPPKDNPWQAALSHAPAKALHWQNPFAGRADALWAGRKLFRRHCAECHGQDAEGSMKAPNLRSPIVQRAAPGTLFWFLTNGNLVHGMPSWSRLPDPERWQLVTYLKSLDARWHRATPPPPNAPND